MTDELLMLVARSVAILVTTNRLYRERAIDAVRPHIEDIVFSGISYQDVTAAAVRGLQIAGRTREADLLREEAWRND
jgi:hypothetical protein